MKSSVTRLRKESNMGIDTDLYLPPYVEVRDVATAIGILLGEPHELAPLGQDVTHCKVENVTIRSYGENTYLPECCRIHVGTREFMYHFAFSTPGDPLHNRGWHGMILRSSSPNIALFVALANFFGGVVDFNDCDEADVDRRVEPSESTWGHDFTPTDGDEWDEID